MYYFYLIFMLLIFSSFVISYLLINHYFSVFYIFGYYQSHVMIVFITHYLLSHPDFNNDLNNNSLKNDDY
jgi:hypothetical protein